MYGVTIAPTFPLVEQRAIIILRETVGKNSKVKTFTS